jgi:hypothetical protein
MSITLSTAAPSAALPAVCGTTAGVRDVQRAVVAMGRTATTHEPQLIAPGQAWGRHIPGSKRQVVSAGGPGLPPTITNSGCSTRCLR